MLQCFTMLLKEILQTLKKLGTAQNRKIYKRHGSGENVYGVSFANLRPLSKKILKDPSLSDPVKRNRLALQLWESGNYDARNLASLIVDPKYFSQKQSEQWVKDVDNYSHASLLGGVIAQTNDFKQIIKRWTASKKEFIKDTGFSALGAAMKDRVDEYSDAELQTYIRQIETEIHDSPNWARYAMNWALIAIGTYSDALSKQVVQTANRIGKVDVDHGETSCKTPDAASYIEKALSRKIRT